MQTISRISLPELAQPFSVSVSLTTRSGPPVPAATGLTLLNLMAETQARFSQQVLPEGTPDMYLVEWEEIALKYGLALFRDALSRAIRKSRFFPDPQDVRRECVNLRRELRERNRQEGLAALRPTEKQAKAAWGEEQERAKAEGREPNWSIRERWADLCEEYLKLLAQ